MALLAASAFGRIATVSLRRTPQRRTLEVCSHVMAV
jgi:hypothetical protein